MYNINVIHILLPLFLQSINESADQFILHLQIIVVFPVTSKFHECLYQNIYKKGYLLIRMNINPILLCGKKSQSNSFMKLIA